MGLEGDFTQTSIRHGISIKMSAVKGQAEGFWLREEGMGSNGVRVMNMHAVGEGGMEKEREGMEREERWID